MRAISDARTRRITGAAVASLVCEFSTVKDGKPITHPLTPFFDPEDEVIFVSSSPALSKKFDDVDDTPAAAMVLY